MRRREFLGLVGGAAVTWPFAVRAQQPTMPVIGFLNSALPELFVERLRGFRLGLKDTGYVEGENVAIEYRWAENRLDRVPKLLAELIDRRVAVITATGGQVPAMAAKAVNSTIPVVFGVPEDPVRIGLVASLGRPGGNMTGVNFFNLEVLAKRLELLRELVPGAKRVAVLNNPANVSQTETILRDMQVAARAIGLQIQIFNASTNLEIDEAFAALMRERPDALFVAPDPLFFGRRVQLSNLAARHALPATFSVRDNAEAGGLMSYGTDISYAYRQIGVYVGRILKGAKPADMPVLQADKFELVINAQTARLLGLTVPPSLLARADEVIE
jgi:putative ABC transport system substrate-binding protein